MDKIKNHNEIKQALLLALKNFDKEIILEIAKENTQDHTSWANGAEILNGLDYKIIKNVMSTIQ